MAIVLQHFNGLILSFNEFVHEQFSVVIGSHDFTWLTKLSQHIHVAEVIKEVVLKEREGAEWEGVIEECKRELCDLSIKTAEDVGWRSGRPYWRHHSDEPGVTRRVAMRTGRGGKHLFSSSDEDSGDNDDDEPPREKQSVDVWLPPAPPNFRDHVWGGHLDEQMQGAALPADAKAAIEKQVNEFHLERTNASGKVNSLVYWAEASRRYPIVAQVARQCLCVPASSASSERSFSKTGHIVRARRARLSEEHVKELSFLSWNQDLL